MAATITWNIAQLETAPSDDGLTDVVKTAHWTVNAVEAATISGETTEYTAGAYGSVGFGEPDPGSFVPYPDVTLSGAIGWVQDSLGAEQVATIESGLVNNIEQQKNPPIVVLPLPWAGN